MTGTTLTLWDPEVSWGDHPKCVVTGTLAQAVEEAEVWLAEYLDVDASTITRTLDPDDFDGETGTLKVETEEAS